MHSHAQRHAWIRGIAAVLGAFAVLALPALLDIHIPNSGAILLVGVVYASFQAGIPGGLAAAALAEALLIGYHVAEGDYASGAIGRGGPAVDVVSFLACVLATALMVGGLQERAERRVTSEREHRERMADLERVKTHFLNVASHELRGPLSVARGYASMLADGSFGPAHATDVREVVPIILNKLDEMNQLVDSMLDTARLEERRLVLVREPTDLRELVDHAVAAVQLLLTPRHQLRWRRPPKRIRVDCDRARLSIVVTNLLQNAIKYSPDGGIVEVFLAADERWTTLTVWDQGLGIAAADLPRLFTRFGRIVTPRNSHIPGTGLGLYLARELARLHDGDLVVTSSAGRGSSFTMVLPAAADGTEELAVAGRAASPEPRGYTRGGEEARMAGATAAPRGHQQHPA